MVLDMEGEFYKLAKRILSSPKNLFKMAALSPKTGRVTLMGADNFVVVTSSILRSLTRSPEKKAYQTGKRCGKEMLGTLVKEFDEEVANLVPKKMFDLGLPLCSSTGWGKFELVSLNVKRSSVSIKAEDTIELNYSKAAHNMLTCGLLAGISTICLHKDIDGIVKEASENHVVFTFNMQ